jgi:antitoxin HigA-1
MCHVTGYGVKLMRSTQNKGWIMSTTTDKNQHLTMKNPPHPGFVVLRECIEPLGLTITDAAEALNVTRNTLSELVNGKRGISPEMAVRLSKVFGGTEEGWLLQQAQYDLAHVRRGRLKLKRLEVA